MSGDDRFDRELRSVLDDLAREPAPDRLVERVSRIPKEAAPMRRLGIARAASALAAAAVIVIVAGAFLVSRPGGGFGGPSAASHAPATPTAAPPVSPQGGLVTIAPASPSPSPSAAAVPSGFQPVSVTFVSPTQGWVLGTSPCSLAPCPAVILDTTDAGTTWQAINAPRTTVTSAGLSSAAGNQNGVSGIRFADPMNGWAYGPELWTTHDGGATWHKLAVPGGSSASVDALEASAGFVQAVVYDMAAPAVRVASSPVAADSWTVSAASVQLGAGPVPQSELVLAGSAGWLVQVDRTVIGGLRLSNGTWQTWTPPCATALGPATLAASSPTDLVAACQGGVWGPPKDPTQQGQHVYVSHDGGATFTRVAGTLPVGTVEEVATTSAGAIYVGASDTQGGQAIVGSTDGGQTWRSLLGVGQSGSQAAILTYLGFTTPQQGVAITQSGTGTGGLVGVGTLVMTTDGGQTWNRVSFGGQ